MIRAVLVNDFYGEAHSVATPTLGAIRWRTAEPCPMGWRWEVRGTREEIDALGGYETRPGKVMIDLGDRWIRAMAESL